MPYVYSSVAYLCNNIDQSINIINDKDILIQSQINNNKMFESKKINETNDLKNMPTIKIQHVKKSKNVDEDKEKCIDKLTLFNDIDSIVSK